MLASCSFIQISIFTKPHQQVKSKVKQSGKHILPKCAMNVVLSL